MTLLGTQTTGPSDLGHSVTIPWSLIFKAGLSLFIHHWLLTFASTLRGRTEQCHSVHFNRKKNSEKQFLMMGTGKNRKQKLSPLLWNLKIHKFLSSLYKFLLKQQVALKVSYFLKEFSVKTTVLHLELRVADGMTKVMNLSRISLAPCWQK